VFGLLLEECVLVGVVVVDVVLGALRCLRWSLWKAWRLFDRLKWSMYLLTILLARLFSALLCRRAVLLVVGCEFLVWMILVR
jgi:hypothetical protein